MSFFHPPLRTVAFLTLVVSLVSAADASSIYSVTKLPFDTPSVRVNTSGQGVTGFATRAYTFDASSSNPNPTTIIPTLGGDHNQPVAITNSGLVVGNSGVAGRQDGHAFTYDGTHLTDLGTLGGSWSQAIAANQNGDVVGMSEVDGNGFQQAFLYHDGVMSPLGPAPDRSSGYPNSSATARQFEPGAINANGLIVGRYEGLAAVLDHGVIQTYAFTDSADPTSIWGGASGVNDRGQIVGSAQVAPAQDHAFLLQNGVMTDLTPDDKITSDAAGINSSGVVAGGLSGWDIPYFHSGFVYDDTGLHLLSDLLSPADIDHWHIDSVVSINDLGQMVAYAQDFTTPAEQEVLLTPVGIPVGSPVPIPEPATLWLVGFASIAFAASPRLRRSLRF